MYIDRGFIVNIEHIMKLKNREAYMVNGEVLPVSGPQLENVRKKIDGVLEKKCIKIIYFGQLSF